MKNIFLLLFAIANTHLFAQDIIIKKNGDEIKSKVIEITDASVKYKKWENINGPIYSIDKSEVFKLKYENGESDFFGNVQPTAVSTNATQANTVNQAAPQSKPAKSDKGSGQNQKTSTAQAANISSGYPQPSTDNVPYYYNQAANTLVELEKTNYTTENRRKGAWGKEGIMILPGPLSNVQLSKKIGNTFIIHFDKTDAEPYSSCVLNTPEVNDKLKQREWVQTTKGAHGTQEQHDDVEIKFKKIGEGLYLITLDKKVKTGELFFMIPSTKEVYSFGYGK